jgi:hypothetical protein
MWQKAREWMRQNILSVAIGTIVGQGLWVGLRWLLKGLAEDRFFSGLNSWFDEHWSLNALLWLTWTALFVGAFVWARRSGTTSASKATASREQTVPLLEAARRAYEQTRGTLVAGVAEARFGDEDRREGTLTWFCYALATRLAIHGNWPPSRVPEEIDWAIVGKRHSFRMRDDALILHEHSGDGYYENLYVLAHELPRALEEIKALSPPALEFVWPEDRALNWHVGKTQTDIFLIVRNPSITVTATGVHVVREWMMRAEHRQAGGTPQRDEVRLPLQFGSGDEVDIEPGGKQRFRLCSIANTTDDDHTLLMPPNRTAGGYNAGIGTFQFQVRARAKNAASAVDLYEIGLATDGGFTTTRKSEDTIDV